MQMRPRVSVPVVLTMSAAMAVRQVMIVALTLLSGTGSRDFVGVHRKNPRERARPLRRLRYNITFQRPCTSMRQTHGK